MSEKNGSLFKDAINEQAYLKAGILGFAGSGKTFTASLIATGLHSFIKSQKPVFFLDSETGADFVLPMFQSHGISLQTAKTRAFVDLLAAVKEAESNCDILIIDSISHFYMELVDAYQKKLKRDRLRVHDWGPIKLEWRQFTDLYINSKLHIIMCGRAAWEYDYQENDDGVTEIAKTGTKMKAESDMSYEPSLLIEMEKVRAGDGKIGQKLIPRAWVIKDRFNVIQGKSFDYPSFESFLPHIELLNLGGKHVGVETDKTSQDLFNSPESRINFAKLREIALENIQNEFLKNIPGRSLEDQRLKLNILETAFGTSSWTQISDLSPDKLEEGLKKIMRWGKEMIDD